MKVKEAIEQLSKLDGELELVVAREEECRDDTYYTVDKFRIKHVDFVQGIGPVRFTNITCVEVIG